ncbi:MAG: glycine cleavage system protein GcvH [Anaerolineaceae bacterium]|nr:glycine cleavage system protein GcvH [Anaerolineaceae bacterium]
MAELKTPSNLKYTKNDEWVKLEGDTATIGISDYAQDALNDIVYVEFPDVGAALEKGKTFGVVESVKAASDIFMPIGGTVTDINSSLEDSPETINTDPYEKGWLIKIKVKDAAEADSLMDSAAYIEFCKNR